ncbi:MAG: hypothetical protein Satyrvirus5_20 [Satyrvirus sp.]|uniref:Uncharacterized protein n=1 Tax=Satyrvirus sp. TaxID=2487771 RepID=A0A3G5AD53_9VIRU|nr:MAG: hypothetical protein Satyrvirus5_20 [Satyrvirus sp.]
MLESSKKSDFVCNIDVEEYDKFKYLEINQNIFIQILSNEISKMFGCFNVCISINDFIDFDKFMKRKKIKYNFDIQQFCKICISNDCINILEYMMNDKIFFSILTDHPDYFLNNRPRRKSSKKYTNYNYYNDIQLMGDVFEMGSTNMVKYLLDKLDNYIISRHDLDSVVRRGDTEILSLVNDKIASQNRTR